MKVYYVGSRYDGCYYVRCLLPLVSNGWDGSRTSMRGNKATGDQMLKGAMNSDIVVFHRPDEMAKVQVAPLLQMAGKKVVYDNDDTYLDKSGIPIIMQSLRHTELLDKMNENLYEMARTADLVTVSTTHLAKEYEKLNDNVAVLPNMVDPYDWGVPKRNEGDDIRIGLIGSVIMTRDYSGIEELLIELSERDNVTIVILGLPPQDDPDFSETVALYSKEYAFINKLKNVEFHNAVPQEDYNDKLNDLRLDIGLIPREDTYFNRSKSNLKFLEASMLEIPIIAQGYTTGDSPYQGKDVTYMRIAITEDDFRKHTEELIASKDKRLKMGSAAKKYVEENYNVYENAHLWENEYKKLLE